jgi:OOP family OmpA-OmpF porin
MWRIEVLTNRLSIVACVLGLTILADTAIAQSGFYAFGSFGTTDFDISFSTLARVDGNDDNYKLGAGYVVNRNLSLEVAYHDFGNQNARTDCPPDFACVALLLPLRTRADSTAYSLSVIGSIPVTERFDVFGKVGIAGWDVGFEGISSVFDTSGEDLLYGAGLRWSINDHWKVFAEYEKIELGVDTAGIGVSYHF